jgi:hypothetical protein
LKISWVSSLMQFGGSNSQGFARESKGEAWGAPMEWEREGESCCLST